MLNDFQIIAEKSGVLFKTLLRKIANKKLVLYKGSQGI